MASINAVANNKENGYPALELNSSQNILTSSIDPIVAVSRNNERKKLKWRIYISVFMMCFGMMIAFAGTTAIDIIQSSLNTDKGLGTASMAVKTASMVIQSLFLNSICIKKFGLKGAIIVGIALELLYTSANFYPTWWTMIPGALISGLGKPMERTAEATYLSRISRLYVDHVLDQPGAPTDVIKTRLFNFYYIFYMASRVLGNVASSLILGSGLLYFDLSLLTNASKGADEVKDMYCGANFCDTSKPNATKIDNFTRVYYLCAFSIGCFAVAIVFILVFLVKDEYLQNNSTTSADTNEDGIEPENRVIEKPLTLLLATGKLWRKLNLLLLVPLTFYNGMDNTFFFADFTKSFVTCPFGIQWVGFTAAWYGVTSPLAVLLCVGLSKSNVRPIPFFVALGCHIGAGITMLYITQFTLVKSFVLSAVWGIGSGLWPYTLSAFYGIVFEQEPEAAYSNYFLLDSVGATLNYSWSYYLCTRTKILVLMVILGVSFVGYIFVEFRLRLRQSTKKSSDSNSSHTSTQL